MKKMLRYLSLIAAVLILSGCSPAPTDGSSDTVSTQSTSPSVQSSATPSGPVTIEEISLLDWNGLKVTAKKYVSDPIWGDGIQVLVENNSNKTYGIGCKALIVNNYMITDLFSVTVAPGKKDNETIHLSSSALEAAGIGIIGQVEVFLQVFDSQTYLTLYEAEGVTIKTSAFDRMDTTPTDLGSQLYNKDGIRISGKYVNENSFWGAGILLHLENTGEKDFTVQCEDMSINGFMVTPLFSCTVFSGKKAVEEITVLSSDLEENGIEKVEDIELTFEILDPTTFQTIATSGPITFKAE